MKTRPIYMFLDPGLRECGISFFSSKGKFLSAHLAINPIRPPTRDFEAWQGMGKAVDDLVDNYLFINGYRIETLKMEVPKHVDGWSNGKESQLLQLAGVLGAISVLIPAKSYVAVHVMDWKKQASKELNHYRIRKKWLNKKEKLRLSASLDSVKDKSLHHNVMDAVGIGMAHFKRNRV